MAAETLFLSLWGENAQLEVCPPQSSTRTARARRPMWMPGAAPPAHLDGTLPGDFGFDPLGLGVEKERLSWWVGDV